MSTDIADHYAQKLDQEMIIQQLKAAYPQGPDHFQLAPIDQLHIGGIKASLKLIDKIRTYAPSSVLDIGSGLGGLMRLADAKIELSMIGLDITHGLNQINQKLSCLCHDKLPMPVVTGDAHALPFSEQQFDLIIFQHSLLNMPDSIQVLAECQRVLKKGGRLLMHEVLEGPQHSEMIYPVPWARSEKGSHLVSEMSLRSFLTQANFTIESFEDWSQDALLWRQRQATKEANMEQKKPPVSPALVLGPEFQVMGGNVMKNLSSHAACVVEVVARKP